MSRFCITWKQNTSQTVIDAVAAVAQITRHTGGPANIPNAIVTTADSSTVLSLSNSSPTTINSHHKRSNNSKGNIKRVKKYGLTAHQAQQQRTNIMLEEERKKERKKERKNKAFKLATLWFAEEKCKEKGNSAATIVAMVNCGEL